MDPETLLDQMRLNYEGATTVFQIGVFDRKVTIYAQQLRAFNLAWALREGGVVKPKSRVAVIGGGAAGLSMIAGLYHSDAEVTLFETSNTFMRLQRRNKRRYLHPNIYEWPKEPLQHSTIDLPALRWSPDYSDRVAKAIETGFSKYVGSFTPRMGVTVGRLRPTTGSVVVPFQQLDLGVVGEQTFDVVIICVGFGLERRVSKLKMVSYWSGDDYSDFVEDAAQPDLVLGCGDGGVTDAIRLAYPGFDHEALEALARMKSLRALGEKMTLAEAHPLSDQKHDALYRRCDLSEEVLDFFRKLKPAEQPVRISDASEYLYRPSASCLNKLILRHVVALSAVEWTPFASISRPAGRGVIRPLLKSVREAHHRVVTRVGPAGAIAAVAPVAIIPSPTPLGYRSGSEAFFPIGYFEKPPERPPVTVLALMVGGGRTPGGGSAGEFKAIRAQLEDMISQPVTLEPYTYDPSIGRYRTMLDSIRLAIDTTSPAAIVVLGSELLPLLTPGLRRKYDYAGMAKRWLGGASNSILGFAGTTPLIYFGARTPEPDEIAANPNLYIARQHVDDDDIVLQIDRGFPDSTIDFVFNPKRYPIDAFFWDAVSKSHKRLTAEGRITFGLRRTLVFGTNEDAEAKIRGTWHRRPKDRQYLFAGRMTAHMLANNHQMMEKYPFISSYGEDVSLGAILSYDNINADCARELVHAFIKPICEGRTPATRMIEINRRLVCGRKANADRHGIQVAKAFINEIDGW